uniref:Uncharacterized protein n=1 Tax=Heterorhabditis bacteriophora TaxID=37862 RepID=A0A1I7X4H9_HETBA
MVGFANCTKENVFSSSSESDDTKTSSTQLQNGSPAVKFLKHIYLFIYLLS